MSLCEYVYRAVSSDNWVKGGRVKDPVFRRRWRVNSEGKERDIWDDDGLSFGLSPEEACQELSKHWGVVKLSVQKMKERGFEFDEPQNGSVHVVNMPFYRREDLDAANEKTMRMRECIVGFIPPELVRVRDVMPKSTHL